MLDRTQEQIMHSWKPGEPSLVSVICATYNHENYIREAIESILMQETDFPFDLIIHDDASTDSTASIVEEYQTRYPKIVKPIYQNENQYSKGGFMPSPYAVGFSRAKYIALCEGDDYWIDKSKLQVQLDSMRKYPEVDISWHSAHILRNGILDREHSRDWSHDRIVDAVEILKSTDRLLPTASFVFRREVIDRLPLWFYKTAPVGDIFIQLYGSQRGGSLYINKPMSVYRIRSEASWSDTMRKEPKKKLIHCERMMKSYHLLEADFHNCSAALDTRRSGTLLVMSNAYLLMKEYGLFKKYIERSVTLTHFISVRQKIYYYLRNMPRLLHILILYIRK